MQTKFLVPLLWMGVVIGVLVAGPRRLLTRPLLWCGAAIAMAGAVPVVAWQASHGWPQLAMTSMNSAETGWIGQILLLPNEVMLAGLLVGSVLCCYGTWQLLRAGELRQYRFLGWAVVVIAVVLLVSGARPYYVAGLDGLVFAAGGAAFERRREASGRRRWRWMLSTPSYLASAALAVIVFFGFTVPGDFSPAPSNADLPTIAQATATAYFALTPDERARTAIVATTYHEAAAIDVYGRSVGLPRGYSAHRGYWYFGTLADTARGMLYVGADVDRYRQYFGQAHQITVASPEPLWLLADRTTPWRGIWQAQQGFA